MRTPTYRSLSPALPLVLILLSTAGLVACDTSNHSPTAARTSASSGKGVLPLIPGVYVLHGADCHNPSNAAIRIYTGTGISGSSTRNCRATIRSREGNTFTADQSCVDTYSSKRSTTTQSIVISDARHFSLREGDEKSTSSFQLCPKGEAPEDLQRHVQPGPRGKPAG